MHTIKKRDLRNEATRLNTIIQVIGGPESSGNEKNALFDEFDGNEPETFTLDEFRNIILEFRNNNKDCIIAKVSTPDHESHDTLFNNYYIASEVNKLLFKFERDRRLLHRMKVRNPLNNQYIIGPVHYYKITCFEIDRAIVDYFFGSQKQDQRNQRRAVSEVFRNSTTEPYISDLQKSKDTSDVNSRDDISCSLMDESPWTVIEEARNGKIKITDPNIDTAKLVYVATYFACDDDFLMRADIREYFRVNSMDPAEEFLFELDRTHNDLFALLDTASDSTDEDIVGWKRVLAVHMSVLITMLGIVILLGANPIILLIAFPLAVLTLISFLCSLLYIMVFRRDTFGSLAVRSVDEV
ncbi:hypothetical protein COBT_002129 [Conglomerata obtusa]